MKQRSRGILLFHDKFLVVRIGKRKRKFYTFPGGHGKKGESLEDACIREFFEETGLRVRIVKIVYKTKEKDHKTYYFFCELDKDQKVHLDKDGYPIVQVVGEEQKRKSKYDSMWLSITELGSVNIYSKEIIGKLKNCFSC